MTKFTLTVLLACLMLACTNSSQVQRQTEQYRFENIAMNQAPERVLNHAAATFPGSSVSRVGQNAIMGYEVALTNRWELYYNPMGDFVYKQYDDEGEDDRPIPISSLPQNILDWIADNYAGLTIVWAEVDDDEYEVYLSDGTELYFDLRGRFIKAELDDVPVDPTSLPAAILSYIQANYPNAQIIKAELDDNYYEVYLDNGFELYFDLNGNFLGLDVSDRPVDINSLPAPIISYVTQNYPTETIVEAEIDDNMYEIGLSNDVDLYFDLAGNFLYAD